MCFSLALVKVGGLSRPWQIFLTNRPAGSGAGGWVGGRVVGGDHMTFEEEEFDSLETVIEDRCELIEVNEVYDSHWEQREFTQILFYDYRNKMEHLIG